MVANHPSDQRTKRRAGRSDGAPSERNPPTPQRTLDLLDLWMGLEDEDIGQRILAKRQGDIRCECIGVVQEGHEEVDSGGTPA